MKKHIFRLKSHTNIVSIILMILISVILIMLFSNNSLFHKQNNQYTNSPLSKEGFYFDTVISITIYDSEDNYNDSIKSKADIEKLLDECMSICEKYEYIFSPTNSNSELYKLNNSQSYQLGQPVEISSELADIIVKAQEYSAVFVDKYSILSGNICKLWDYEEKCIPSEKEINNALTALKTYTLSINNNTIIVSSNTDNSVSVPQINLGAFAKGYIADRLGEFLCDQGIEDAIIDLGGNILVIGDKYNDTMYTIGIKKPFAEASELSAVCKIADKSVVTSGIYERYFEKDGTIYHHIIDCSTGYPANNGILSVTIICDSSFIADCYSTGCLLYPAEFILDTINSTSGIECVIIDNNYNLILSDGLTFDDDCIVIK